MRKVIVVAVREYQAAVKTKAFIVTLVAMPVLLGGSIAVSALLEDKVDTSDKRLAVVDYSGVLYDALAEAARLRNSTEIFDGEEGTGRQVRPKYVMEKVDPQGDAPAEVEFQLSERVRKGEIMAFVIIGPDVIKPGEDPSRSTVAYHSNTPTYDNLRRWLRGVLNDHIHTLRLRAANLDPEVVEEATRPTRVLNLGLVELDQYGGVTQAQEANEFVSIGIPMILMMLMFMVVLIGAQPLMQSVLEEKTQRIAEVLLGSVPPFQLMLGKLVGVVGVSLTLAAVYLVGGFIAMIQAGYGELFPAHLLWWFVVFQALAVLMFGSLFIAIGAAVSDLKEAQSLVTPASLVIVAPMFVLHNVIQEPASTLSVVLSLIPPATPMLMVLRQAVPPGVPLWQPLLGVGVMLLTTAMCVFAAGRIFRVGILMQGKGARVGEMLRWIVRA